MSELSTRSAETDHSRLDGDEVLGTADCRIPSCSAVAAAAPVVASAPAAATDAGDGPSPSSFHLLGQTVYVPGLGKARVLSGPIDGVGREFQGHCLVEALGEDGQPTGRTRHVYPRQMRQLRNIPARVLVVETTRDYREAAFHFTQPDDIVLEVGCHFGLTTHALHQRAAFVVGVDKSEDNVAEARRRFPGVRFEAADGFDLKLLRSLSPRFQGGGGEGKGKGGEGGRDGPAGAGPGDVSSGAQHEGQQDGQREEKGGDVLQQQLQLQQEQQQVQQEQQQQQQQQQHEQRGRQKGHSQDWRRPLFTKVFIDVGGIAELHTVMALVGLYTRQFLGANIVVKSKYLKNLLGHTMVWHPSMLHGSQGRKASRCSQGVNGEAHDGNTGVPAGAEEHDTGAGGCSGDV